jgi:hypothetical protein
MEMTRAMKRPLKTEDLVRVLGAGTKLHCTSFRFVPALDPSDTDVWVEPQHAAPAEPERQLAD